MSFVDDLVVIFFYVFGLSFEFDVEEFENLFVRMFNGFCNIG